MRLRILILANGFLVDTSFITARRRVLWRQSFRQSRGQLQIPKTHPPRGAGWRPPRYLRRHLGHWDMSASAACWQHVGLSLPFLIDIRFPA